ncbi:uncharacterized protein LACBIDRAFT_333280 [Laccaria bicolor S238N-H82]|uniref:Predicted protein n=1 Tax=Laccaria bicolor (strain S238N-H82 / ATCC MYA-4686) TaxID=486041 RepID=B0DVG1_LACBS|nr:uncharacterized protein LACBIDRAFT_333280 [Laccaria bicolor S238N-H82]EDR01377.1 predicted protein [Laccaria bicolor S238N-H82]|eukprot:XP_001887922.1 predicted protein [Laccaria bicolor S238N-H82]
MTPWAQSHDHSNSPAPSNSKNVLVLSTDTSRANLFKVTLIVALRDVELTSCDHVSEIAQQYEVDKNAAQAKLDRLSRKFADITNDEDDNSSHQPKHRRTRHESPPVDPDDEIDATNRTVTDEHFVYQAGHKFFLICAPWIRSGEDLFDTDIDEHYNAAERFENDKKKVQGQIHEILDLLQEKIEQDALRQRWLRRQFMNGLKPQRYNTATRIRHCCALILGASEIDLLQADIRKAKFHEDIGWVSETGQYSSVDVPILHKDWHGGYLLSSVFLNPKLMGARWALSSDDALQEVGSNTGIRYFNDFEEYLTILETGLQQRKKSILNIIKQWDEKIFQNSESSLVMGVKNDESCGLKRAMELLAADSEEEEDQMEDQDGNGNAGTSSKCIDFTFSLVLWFINLTPRGSTKMFDHSGNY